MAINIVKDELIPLQTLRQRFPMASGKQRSMQSILKWVTVGVKGSHRGQPVRLEAERVGGTWYTTEDALLKFAKRMTDRGVEAVPVHRSARQSKAHARATAKLKARGVCK